MRWIEALCEPRQLVLAWQPADLAATSRARWAVGLLTPVGDEVELRYFQPGGEFEHYNLPGKMHQELLVLGYKGYPAFSTEQQTHRTGVKQALMRRLPPRRRLDFAEYAAQFRLRDTDGLSDFALLARTEAKVPSDGFSVVDPLEDASTSCDVLVEVAGFRHYMKDVPQLSVGQAITIAPEPGNKHDVNAVATLADGRKIGNINRLQAVAFLRWLETARVDAWVERVNGTAERPRVFLFVRVRPHEFAAAA